MVDDHDNIKIIDFGISANSGARRITFAKLTDTMGTPDYISPEQVKGGRGDARSDVYAVGVMLYEMLTGSVPFTGSNAFVIMNDRLLNDPVPPRELNPELSPQLQEVLYRALERNPHNRYGSARDFAHDLEHLDQVGVEDRPELPTGRSAAPRGRAGFDVRCAGADSRHHLRAAAFMLRGTLKQRRSAGRNSLLENLHESCRIISAVCGICDCAERICAAPRERAPRCVRDWPGWRFRFSGWCSPSAPISLWTRDTDADSADSTHRDGNGRLHGLHLSGAAGGSGSRAGQYRIRARAQCRPLHVERDVCICRCGAGLFFHRIRLPGVRRRTCPPAEFRRPAMEPARSRRLDDARRGLQRLASFAGGLPATIQRGHCGHDSPRCRL